MIRCAIYTRKSTEERLDQRYNSLEAQRDACLSYVASQKLNGWVALEQQFDDGGFSGGSLDRPALKELRVLIEHSQIEVVVVHKVDRLTRSLSDFAKLADLFDRHKVSFVSVTQSLDTSTSMGRLSLNVLLSFAQFEREIASERIREKIAASRRKGLWTGGVRPIGYDIVNKALIPNEEECRFVAHVFDRYIALGSVSRLQKEMETLRVPGAVFAQRLSRGALYTILKNPIYVGKLRSGRELINAVHLPIVEQNVWDKCSELMHANKRKGRRNIVENSTALLLGKLFDSEGHAITRSKTFRHGKVYTYYVTARALRGKETKSKIRMPCSVVDSAIMQGLRDRLSDQTWFERLVEAVSNSPDLVRRILRLPIRDASDECLCAGIERVVIEGGSVTVRFDGSAFLSSLGLSQIEPVNQSEDVKLVLPSFRSSRPLRTKTTVIVSDKEWLRHGRRWLGLLATGRVTSQSEIAAEEGVSQATVSRAIDRALRLPI